MSDVIIIGGGPVGSYVADQLAGLGYQVTVLEKKEKIGEKVCCTGLIGQECVSAFPMADDVILRQLNSARLFSSSGSLLKLWREETQAYVLDRSAFDLAIARRAQDRGAEYALKTMVRNIAIEGDRVRVEASCQKETLTFVARVAIIATGFSSKLAESLGLGKFGDFVLGAQAEVATTGIDEVEVYFGKEMAPGFFGWLVPTSPGMARVGLLSRHDPGVYLRKLMTALQRQEKIASAETELSYGGIPLKPLGQTYGERVLVVGTAAGQVKPTSGGGIYYGLLCADIAAQTLHEALQKDDLSARSLSRYERRWRRRLGRELRTGYWARKLFERLNDRQIDQLFNIVKDNGIVEALLKARDLSFDWHHKAILRILGRAVVARALGVVKVPSRISED